jgi:hypothetical protein
MNKTEMLLELPKLGAEERHEIFGLLCDLEERDLLAGRELSAADREMLDREMEDYLVNPDPGSTWDEVEARLRQSAE